MFLHCRLHKARFSKMKFTIRSSLTIALIIFSSFFTTQIWQKIFFPWTLERLSLEHTPVKSIKFGIKTPGAKEFMQGPQSLAAEVLHLSSWFGHQGINFIHQLEISQISLWAKLSKSSYLDISLNQETNIRFSQNNRYPPQIFHLNSEGKFLKIKPFAHPVISDEQLSHFKIKLNKPILANLSVRQGPGAVSIQKIELLDKNGQQIFTENFTPKNILLSWLFAVIFIFFLGLYLLYPSFFPVKSLCLFTMIIFLTITFTQEHTYPRLSLAQLKNEFELNQKVKIEKKISKLELKKNKKIIAILGKSQLAQMENKLEKTKFNNYDVLSFAFLGATSPLEYKTLELLPLNVSGVVASFPQQHLSNAEYENIFQRLLEETKKRNINLVIMSHPKDGPVSWEVTFLKNFCQKNQISFIDAYQFMEKHRNDGYLWWDDFHLTELGQTLYSEFISSKLNYIINKNFNETILSKN